MSKSRIDRIEKDRALKIIDILSKGASVEDVERILEIDLVERDFQVMRRVLESKYRMFVGLRKHLKKEKNLIESVKCAQEMKKIDSLFDVVSTARTNWHALKIKRRTSSGGGVSADDRIESVITAIGLINYFYDKDAVDAYNSYISSDSYSDKMIALKTLSDGSSTKVIELDREKKELIGKIYKAISKENKLDGNLRDNKDVFYSLLEDEKYSDYSKKIEEVSVCARKSKLILEYVRKLITLENNKHNSIIVNSKVESESDYIELLGEDLPIYREFVKIIRGIKSGKYINQYDGVYLPIELEMFFENLKNVDNERLFKLSSLGSDITKYKMRSIKKNVSDINDFERSFLKRLNVFFRSIKPIEEYYEEDDTSFYYEIIKRLSYDDNNYFYIEKLLKSIPTFANCKNEDGHILIGLLDEFIYSYRIKISNQKKASINPTFYKEIIKLFFENGAILSEDELILFEAKLNEFEEYCTKKKYNCLSDIIKDIEEINACCENDSINFEKIDRKKLKDELASINGWRISEVVEFFKRKNYPIYNSDNTNEVFIIEGIDNYAFSINYELDGSVSFGIHIMDTSRLVDDCGEVWKAICANKKVLPKFDNVKEYPVMSFITEIDSNNNSSGIKINQGIIKVNKVYSSDELINYRNDSILKNFIKNLHIINSGEDFVASECDAKDLENIVNGVLSDEVGQRFEKSGLPFIYKKELENNEQLILDNHNNTCQLLSNIPKSDAHKIFDILDKNTESYYIPSYSKDGEIEFDTRTYLGIYLLDIFNKIRTGTYSLEAEMDSLKDKLNILNGNRSYLPSGVVISNDKKIKTMSKKFPEGFKQVCN